MKSSKMDFEETDNTKSLSPVTVYHPFRSSFDPEFSAPSLTPGLWSNASKTSTWSQNTERSSSTPAMSGALTSWDLHRSAPQPSASLLSDFSSASASGSREPKGRSICNTSWKSTPSSEASFSGLDDSHSSQFGMFSSNNAEYVGGPVRAGSYSSEEVFDPRHAGFDRSLLVPAGRNLFRSGQPRLMMCNFCKNNKEVPDIYMTHYLYDPVTKILSCPVLRKHVCEICGGTGDQAHTLQYCPLNRGRGLQSKVPVLLRTRTITNSTGKIRRN